jgi:hypothetical protein
MNTIYLFPDYIIMEAPVSTAARLSSAEKRKAVRASPIRSPPIFKLFF